MNLESLLKNGFLIQEFVSTKFLIDAQDLVRSQFPCDPVKWHELSTSTEEHLLQVKNTLGALIARRCIPNLIHDNKELYYSIFGPDFDVQRAPHLRITRPEVEGDAVDWHRDTFYGNTVYEINLWFPLFPLGSSAGVRILPGSHITPSRHLRDHQDSNEFRKAVLKGSTANQLGFVYAPKTDDALDTMDLEKTVLLSPDFGSFAMFFGCAIHKGQNKSEHTRISVDARIKNSYTPTNTKPGYYENISRGIITDVGQRFLTEDRGSHDRNC